MSYIVILMSFTAISPSIGHGVSDIARSAFCLHLSTPSKDLCLGSVFIFFRLSGCVQSSFSTTCDSAAVCQVAT